jgi:hypothetical protein
MADILNDIFGLIDQEAEKLFEPIKAKAFQICYEETPVDKGDLRQTLRYTVPKPLTAEFKWGNEVGITKEVDYQDDVTVKGSKGQTINQYWLAAEKRIENEL